MSATSFVPYVSLRQSLMGTLNSCLESVRKTRTCLDC
jgi:hypothetical protein